MDGLRNTYFAHFKYSKIKNPNAEWYVFEIAYDKCKVNYVILPVILKVFD